MPIPSLSRQPIDPSPVLHRLSECPAAAAAVFFILGIASAQFCASYAFSGLVPGTCLLLTAAGMALRKHRIMLAGLLGLTSLSLCGFMLALAQRDRFADIEIRALLEKKLFPLSEPAAFDGCVIEESEKRGNDYVTTVEFHGIRLKEHWIAAQGKGILRIGIPDPGNPGAVIPRPARGDRIRGWAVWQTPRNYENPGAVDQVGRLARRGVFITGRSKSLHLLETIPGDCAAPWTKFANEFRNRARTGLLPVHDKDNGQQSAILASLVIGDYTGLSTSTREAFQNTGTFHVLVVSGLHVAWIAGVLLQLFRFVLPERLRYLSVALAILMYTCVVGFQASITRCLWIFILYLLGRMLFRKADPLNILFMTALLLLSLAPDWLYDPGFQLSFLSVMAITLTASPWIQACWKPLWEPVRHCGHADRLYFSPDLWQRRGRRLRVRCELLIEECEDLYSPALAAVLSWICRNLAALAFGIGSMILISVAVQLWIEPLLTYHFNRLSWFGPLANIIIVPLSSLVLAGGIAGTLAGITGNAFLIKLSGALASFMLAIAAHIAQIPAAWQRCPTPAKPWILAIMLLLFLWGFWRWRKEYIPISCAVILLAYTAAGIPMGSHALLKRFSSSALSGSSPPWPQDSALLKFVFLDVGEGDAIIIGLPDGRRWILDAGGLRIAPGHDEHAYAFDIGEAVVSRYLWNQWITRLDRAILSHTDLDHAGGMSAIMANFRIHRFEYSQVSADPALLNRLLESATKAHVSTYSPCAGRNEQCGPVIIRTLNPVCGTPAGSANADSLVLQFSYRRFSALLTGDLEKKGETDLLARPGLQKNLLLKAAHHGSRYSTGNAFLDRVKPKWVILSAGRNNPYKHPSTDVLARLRMHKVQALSTIDYGAITLETDGIRYRMHSHIWGVLEQGRL